MQSRWDLLGGLTRIASFSCSVFDIPKWYFSGFLFVNARLRPAPQSYDSAHRLLISSLKELPSTVQDY